MQDDFDLTAARIARDEGMQRAVDHADRVEPNWSVDAFAFLRRFISTATEFTSEDVRRAWASDHRPMPPDNRAWGPVLAKAVKAGLIARDGYATARDPKVHCSIISVWRVV